jgi:catechol 2,3-dioxygenase-like lactoylglutathione lyase family enzyme
MDPSGSHRRQDDGTIEMNERRAAGMATGFHHIGISVADLDRSIAFYRDWFGMAEAGETVRFGGEDYLRIMGLPSPEGRMCMMAKDSLMLEMFEFARPTPAAKDPNYSVADHGLTHFGVCVENIDEIYERMSAAGVRFHCPVLNFPGGMKAVYGRDPDGNVFELLEQVE